MTTNTHDVIIVGAGMVGLSLACLLGASGLRIAVLDTQQPPSLQDCVSEQFSIRVSAITHASQRILHHIGVWSRLPLNKISPFTKMEVWDALGNGYIDFDSMAIGESTLGYIVDNRVLQAALFQCIQQYTHIDFICPTDIKSMDRTANGMQITTQHHKEHPLTAHLVVGADGANSRIRQIAGITVQQHDYGQTALVCNVVTSLPHHKVARQRFLAAGPLAFLPLTDPHQCSIVWTTTPTIAKSLLECPVDELQRNLAENLEHRLGNILEISDRAIFPLRSQHVDKYIKPHLALVGDAAHSIHPLAGQGVNLGFLDAACLAEVLLDGKTSDFCSFRTLRRYERWRKSENAFMLAFVNSIQQMFSKGATPLRTVANLGIIVTDKCSLLKNFFIQRAMGLTGDLPNLN